MGRLALRRWDDVRVSARCRIELDVDAICLLPPEGRRRQVQLRGTAYEVRDATRDRRFVKHLTLTAAGSRDSYHLITPPEEGAIAPRVARLPGVPDDSLVLAHGHWDTVVSWLRTGGSLGGRTIVELARLVQSTSENLAVRIGEFAAELASMASCDALGPMRGCDSPRQALAPFFSAARQSERAEEALVAALASITRQPAY